MILAVLGRLRSPWNDTSKALRVLSLAQLLLAGDRSKQKTEYVWQNKPDLSLR